MSLRRSSLNSQLQHLEDRLEKEKEEAFKPTRRGSISDNGDHSFYIFLRKKYEKDLFSILGLDKRIFEIMVSVLNEIETQKRGKKSFFGSIKDRVLLVYLYLAKGSIEYIRLLAYPKIKTTEQIQRFVNSCIQSFEKTLVQEFIEFKNEQYKETDVTSIIDCTVIPCSKPLRSFKDSMVYYSGKSNMYCIKKEVVVNINQGTCCYISKGYPGSCHDMRILKETKDAINESIKGSHMICDKGYIGVEQIIPNASVPNENEQEDLRIRRCFVERYFGRLKTKFAWSRNKYRGNEALFDSYFNVCCCICNIDITLHSLESQDQEDYVNYTKSLRRKYEELKMKRRNSNNQYRKRKSEELKTIGDDETWDDN